jgi:hypothetical protein
MRIVTWNMGYWQYSSRHKDAWRYLRGELRPDIALLQETVPQLLDEGEQLTFSRVHAQWGTAVYARDLELVPISCEPEATDPARDRYVAGACIRVGGLNWIVVSVHAPIIKSVFPNLEVGLLAFPWVRSGSLAAW